MARVLILGGGFAGVVAAERLGAELGSEHQITLVSRSQRFVFYPALVRLAFGKCEVGDVSFDLRQTMLRRRVNFVEGEVARIDHVGRRVIIAHGEVEGKLPYDYLIFALGRRPATERITGFYEYAHHLLDVEAAIRFGKAIAEFHGGRVIIGQCPGARLAVPVYEAAFAMAELMDERGETEQTRITIVSPEAIGLQTNDPDVKVALTKSLTAHRIEFLSDFSIERVSERAVITSSEHSVNFDLLMLLPPFLGSSAASSLPITNREGYINVDSAMRVIGIPRIYAIGDSVNFGGPKMGHMAVRQAEVAATNLVAEVNGLPPISNYFHEMRLVIDAGGSDSMYVSKDLWVDGPASVRQGRFWAWAKRAQEKYWEASHS
jgi:sulfide:quinone oxidoreductase